MPITVLIEPLPNHGFRATSGPPLPLTVEAPTRDEALAQLQSQLQVRLETGGEVVSVELTPQPHPWMEFAGMYDADDPEVQAWEKAVAEYRRKVDAHPDLP